MSAYRDVLIARLLAALSHLTHENQVRVICASFYTGKLEKVVEMHERITSKVRANPTSEPAPDRAQPTDTRKET